MKRQLILLYGCLSEILNKNIKIENIKIENIRGDLDRVFL
jgi:hypothetical protein